MHYVVKLSYHDKHDLSPDTLFKFHGTDYVAHAIPS